MRPMLPSVLRSEVVSIGHLSKNHTTPFRNDNFTFGFLFTSVTLPRIQYETETNNYTVHQNERKPLSLSEECPISTTSMIFDE